MNKFEADKDFFRDIIVNSVDGVLVLDQEGVVQFANPAAEHMLDRMAPLVGNIFGFPMLADRPTEIDIKRKSGEMILAEMRLSPIIWHGTNAYLASLRNMTDRRRIENDLIRAKEQAFKASKLKTDFLANVSHEIRTPLNAMLGMSDLLGETNLDLEQQRFLEVIQRAGNSLLALLNDLLDLSKIEAGQMQLENHDFDLHVLLDSTLDLMRHRAEEKGLVLDVEVTPEVARSIRADSHRLRQILLNLIGNAIKFTSRGRVHIRVEMDPVRTGSTLFSIIDSGIGIPKERWAAVFKRFIQADTSTSRQHGGSGLGLTIVRELVDLMRGHVWLDSEVGKGTTFFVSIPFAEAIRPSPASDRPFAGFQVLVIEPDLKLRTDIRSKLSLWGMDVNECKTWEEALRFEDSPIDVVVSRTLSTRNIVLTDSNPSWTVGRAQVGWKPSSGFPPRASAYFAAPVTTLKLAESIGRALDRMVPPSLAEAAVETNDIDHKLRVLLVEDSIDNQALIREYLRSIPHELDVAENGHIGFEKFKSRLYDIVLMDMQMPVVDGFESTRMIRYFERDLDRKPTSIIALTASALASDLEKTLRAGCNRHVTKPVSKKMLLTSIFDELSSVRDVREPVIESRHLG